MGTFYPGDHIDFRHSTFHGDVSVEQHHHHYGAVPKALASLPAAPVGFTGRYSELDTLLGLLDPAADPGIAVAAVAGLPGVGKTALVLTAGQAARERCWVGAALFIDLHGYDDAPVPPTQALDILLRALGVPVAHIPPTMEERAALYRSRLHEVAETQGAVLVVADNVAVVDQVRQLLPGTGPNRMLITSRHTLSTLGARLIDLPPLLRDDATRLLDTALRTAVPHDERVAEDPVGALELARRCGYLPLALQIAVALLITDPRLTPALLAMELGRAPLEHLDDGDRAVRAAFNLSFRRLPAAAAEVFRRLALSPGTDLSTQAAAAVSGLPEVKVARLLGELARAHLLEHGALRGRWHMHDLIRHYAAEQVETHVKDAPERARTYVEAHLQLLRGYYGRTALDADAHLQAPSQGPETSGFASRQQALVWLDTERGNLIAAVASAHKLGYDFVAIDLALCLAAYLDRGRHFDELLMMAGIAVAASRAVGDRDREYRALGNLGMALHGLRRFEEAKVVVHAALVLCQQLGDRRGEAMAWNHLGTVLHSLRRFEEAVTALARAGDAFKELGDPHGEAATWGSLGNAFHELDRLEEAVSAHQRDIDLCRNFDDRYGEAVALMHLGRVRVKQQWFDEAITDLKTARDALKDFGDLHGEAVAWMNLSIAFREMGRFDEAVATAEPALPLFQAAHSPFEEGRLLSHMALTMQAAGRADHEVRAGWETAANAFRSAGAYSEAADMMAMVANPVLSDQLLGSTLQADSHGGPGRDRSPS
ncbi:tetratricopeptide repeat protein [Streptomyces chattanoogensis]|uniref:tetratricopeptide repeat protein n=1 Tax=Streptomyces chattanoogensis TaxID=66876 RepID=UPI003697F12D